MSNRSQRNQTFIYLAGLILLIPALLINLGRLNIFMAVDEATRGLVALEMMVSGNYLTPTINGEIYLNKPPLFNWILIIFYSVFGINEFAQRLPTVVSLIGLGFTIYYFVGKELGKKTGIITAFVFVTSGRVFYWESLLGYIDMTFAWVVYTGIMFTYKFMKERKFLSLFLSSFLFMTIGFFLKGLPSIIFQGITLLVVFIYEKEFKRFFSWQFVAGAMIFIVFGGVYYYFFSKYNPIEKIFYQLWTESAQRTLVDTDKSIDLKHILEFPVNMMYHYLPWTLLLLFLFVKRFWSTVWAHPFLKFNLLVFFFNLIPYWTSPEVYPKYIMMLMPMIFTVSVFFFIKQKEENKKLVSFLEMIFLAAAILVSIGYLIIPFMTQFHVTSFVILKSILLFIISGILVYLYIKFKAQRIVIFAIVLIVGRIALDWFIWPQRESAYERFEEDAIKIAQITGDKEIRYFHAPMLQYGASFIITREKWMIIRQEESVHNKDCYYITDDAGLEMIREDHHKIRIIYQYPNAEDGRNLNLIRIDGY